MARIPRFADVNQVADPYAIGHPKYRTSWRDDGAGIAITIELALSHDVADARRAQIAAAVVAELTAGSAPLRRALHDGAASLRVDYVDALRPDLISQAHSGGVWSPA